MFMDDIAFKKLLKLSKLDIEDYIKSLTAGKMVRLVKNFNRFVIKKPILTCSQQIIKNILI